MPTKRIPLAFTDRARLRLPLVGGLVALHDSAGVIAPERYVRDEAGGFLALMSEPQGEVVAEVEGEAPEAFGHAYGSEEE